MLNNSLPAYLGTTILHWPPVTGDPLGSTVSATLWVQLLATALAAVPILDLTRWWGDRFSDLYLRVGRKGWWLLAAVVVFVARYLASAAGMTQRLNPNARRRRLGVDRYGRTSSVPKVVRLSM